MLFLTRRNVLGWSLAIIYLASYWNGLTMCTVRAHKGNSGDNCDSKLSEIGTAIETFSSGDYRSIEQAKNALLLFAKESAGCRSNVVHALMVKMDQPHLDFERDVKSYYLWREGAQILGELKASEALDLLVSRLDLNNGYHSSSQVYQPAIPGIVKMGAIAVPKLATALQTSSNPNLRLAAAYCLTSIGGSSAMKALSDVRGSEPNKCVSQFIDISLETFVHKSRSGRLLFNTNAPHADARKRTRWLAAFECTD
jgi:hypothetical protein